MGNSQYRQGFVARTRFYMTARYDGTDGDVNLQLVESAIAGAQTFAKLSMLLDWNRRYPRPNFADMLYLGVVEDSFRIR